MSFLSGMLPSRIRLPGASQHELPIYNSPPQSPASFPPRPVSSSIYASRSAEDPPAPAVENVSKTVLEQTDDMLVLRRKERQLEQQLQDLLDVQSDALLSGSSSNSHAATPSEFDVRSIDSNASRTQSPFRTNHDNNYYFNNSNPAVMTPAMARRDIYRSIRELAALKGQEQEIAKREVRRCRTTQRHLASWADKRIRLQTEIKTIKEQDDRVRTQRLQKEASKLQDEITQTEQKLAQMRQRHRALVTELAEINNSVQSKLTSYVSSLELLEEDIQRYLASPPQQPRQISFNAETDLWTLPAKRRTLDMAQEAAAAQTRMIEKDAKTIQQEKAALVDGSALWKSAINKIEGFERHLKQQMRTLGADSDSAHSSMSDLLAAMDTVIDSVGSDLELATTRGWKLLVACIGAELEAFRQGRRILRKAAGVAQENDHDHDDEAVASDGNYAQDTDEASEPEMEEEEDNTETVWNTPRASKVLIPVNDDEDDAPDPELMFSPPAHGKDD